MSVLLRKPRSYAEVYNDLDSEVVNLFRVLRGPYNMDLRDQLFATPFSREEFMESYKPCLDEVERARRLVIRSFMGFGSNGHNRSTGFRSNSNRSGTTPAHDWANYADILPEIIERLRGVVIENRDAKAVMAQQDGPDTLHYLDPPYVFSTRADLSKDYAFELTDEDHGLLLDFAKTLKGIVIISGYMSEAYETSLEGWLKVKRQARADGAALREEILWLNPKAAASQSAKLF